MASTNKTTHYNLSQYVGSDKPTYLVDYNTDMQNIDAGINTTKEKADNNESAIGTLENLETVVKTDLVSSINEINEIATDNKSNIESLQETVNSQDTTITNNTTHIGQVADLETTEKSNLVGAVNEILEKFNLNNITSYQKANMTVTGGSISSGTITVAKNSDGSILKIYGRLRITKTAQTVKVTIQANVNVTEDITVSPLGSENGYTGDNLTSAQLKTNGDIVLTIYGTPANNTVSAFFYPVLIFAKNFGDVV